MVIRKTRLCFYCVSLSELKYRIPYLNLSGADYWPPTDASDVPLAAAYKDAPVTRYRNLILQTMANCTLFTYRNGAAQDKIAVSAVP